MRTGFCRGISDSRGVHHCDPTAERKRAEHWRQKADEVDDMGYTRFAAKLRQVADDYDRDAERYSQEELLRSQ